MHPLLAVLVLGLLNGTDAGTLAPQAASPIDLDAVTELQVDPQHIVLDDPRAIQRVLVTGKIGNRLVDLTERVSLRLSDDAIAKVVNGHDLVPLKNGTSELSATAGKGQASAKIEVRNFDSGRSINFPRQIVPIFTKLSCNSGGCHGKSGGQNGFALSLLGFIPEDDYSYLVKDGRGRRLFPAAPQQSLLLRKGAGQLPHGGGKLLKPGDDNYQLLFDWIRQGMPYGSKDDPVVTRIDVSPPHRIMDRQATQRLRVSATYSDGHVEDVTRHALFQSNSDVAAVDETGKVTTAQSNGEAAIMARYAGQVAVFRSTVPTGADVGSLANFQPINYIDEAVAKKWKDLGLVPSGLASDARFIRRASLDLCGKFPDPQKVGTFLASTDSDKRAKLIDELVDSPDFASFMAMKWGAILQNKRGNRGDFAAGTHAMSLWLKKAIQDDMPYDQFVRAILTASGTPESNPPVVWFRSVRTTEENVDNISQLFLGTRIQCARCHHHPFEKWSQDDYYGMAAFFGRLGRKRFVNSSDGQAVEAVFTQRGGSVKNPRTGAVVAPHGLDAKPLDIPAGEDPRQKLVDWLTDPANRQFHEAFVNRLWGHFFSRGIVDPIDDMRVTNPPTNPELLEALAKDFRENKLSMKHMVRRICKSRVYQLDSEPTPANAADTQNYTRYYPKRLAAEVLLDAVDTVTGVPTNFGYPVGMRAVDLPDERINSYFLDVFGRPERSTSCECERVMDANLGQALHLLNSGDIQGKIANVEGRAQQLAKDTRPEAEKVNELFLRFFARTPTENELKTALDYIGSKKDKATAYQDLIWALLNTKEFQFNT